MTNSSSKPTLDATQRLGMRAVEQKLIPSFATWVSSEGVTFYIPDENRGEPLTIEQAHSQFKNLLGIP